MIIYTKHALERMNQRNINKKDIDNISPKDFVNNQTKDGLGHFILQIQLNGHLLRIFYQKEGEDIKIITVYET